MQELEIQPPKFELYTDLRESTTNQLECIHTARGLNGVISGGLHIIISDKIVSVDSEFNEKTITDTVPRINTSKRIPIAFDNKYFGIEDKVNKDIRIFSTETGAVVKQSFLVKKNYF